MEAAGNAGMMAAMKAQIARATVANESARGSHAFSPKSCEASSLPALPRETEPE